MASPAASPCIPGIGLRHRHYAQLVEERPALGFVEVHSENFYADGGAALAVLDAAREHYPVSLHGVGLALGSAAGIDAWHLDRLERLVNRSAPARVSDHACFARAPARPGGPVLHASDLLPIAFNEASLTILCDNVSRVQDRLRRPLLVENLSAYLSFRDSTLAEAEFLAMLCQRNGCGLLLDVNNLMVNALNECVPEPLSHGLAFIDALPLGIVGEIHLAGYCETPDIVIDDHGSAVRPAVWALYERALQRFGAVPTLIEWDTDVPPLEVLLAEAQLATNRLARLHR
ncbi:MAG: DUF692 domain-containing protein [Burkholderiales bacterium]